MIAVKKKILCIDDDKHMFAMMNYMLTAAGFEVECAVDGEQGVEFASRIVPDLIICDYMMPAGGGATVYEHVRKSKELSEVPFLVFSAANKELIEAKITFDAKTKLLQKPVQPPVIVETVKAMLAASL